MSYSGTVSTTVFSTRKLFDSAFRRCRVPLSTVTPEHIVTAQEELYLLLSSLPLVGDQLWTRERVLLPLYEGVGYATLPTGTVDIANANFRTLQELTGTATTSPTQYVTTFSEAEAISTVGLKWSAAAVPFVVERSDDNTLWTTVYTDTPSAGAGEWTWLDLSPVETSVYLRIRALSGTLSFERVFFGQSPTSVPLGVINADDYANLPNRTFQSSRVSQYWFDMQLADPVMRVWPVPDATAELGQLEVWRRRYIMDVGSLAQEIEVPQRWYDSIVAGLAARLARAVQEVDPALIPQIDEDAQGALRLAQNSESDGSNSRIMPNISAYTR